MLVAALQEDVAVLKNLDAMPGFHDRLEALQLTA